MYRQLATQNREKQMEPFEFRIWQLIASIVISLIFVGGGWGYILDEQPRLIRLNFMIPIPGKVWGVLFLVLGFYFLYGMHPYFIGVGMVVSFIVLVLHFGAAQTEERRMRSMTPQEGDTEEERARKKLNAALYEAFKRKKGRT